MEGIIFNREVPYAAIKPRIHDGVVIVENLGIPQGARKGLCPSNGDAIVFTIMPEQAINEHIGRRVRGTPNRQQLAAAIIAGHPGVGIILVTHRARLGAIAALTLAEADIQQRDMLHAATGAPPRDRRAVDFLERNIFDRPLTAVRHGENFCLIIK